MMIHPSNHRRIRSSVAAAGVVLFAIAIAVVAALFLIAVDIDNFVVDAWTLFVPPSVGVVSRSGHRIHQQHHGCHDKLLMPLRPPTSTFSFFLRRRQGRIIAANERREGRKSFATTALWDAYEDQYAAFLNSAAQDQNHDQNQQQQQQTQQQQDMLNQHSEFQQFSTSQTTPQNGEIQPNQEQTSGSSLASSSSSSSYPEPAYSSSIFGSGTGTGAGSYLDNLNNQQQQDRSNISSQPPPLPKQQQDTTLSTSSISATIEEEEEEEEEDKDDGDEKSNQNSKQYQDNISTTSFSFADLAPEQSGAITSSFTFVDTVSRDAAALLAEQLSKTQSELEKVEEEIESVTLSILNDDDDNSSAADESATIQSSSPTSGNSFNSTYGSMSKTEISHVSNRPSFTIIPPSSSPDVATETATSVGFTYSDGISSTTPEVSISEVMTETDDDVTMPKDRRFRRDYLEEYSERTPTSSTVVTVEIEQLFPAGTDILKLKDAWLDFVWTNGGGIMIPKKTQSKQQQQQQRSSNDIREFWIPFGLKQELVSVDTQNNNDGSQEVMIVYRTIRRGPFFQDFVVGTHVGTVVFDTKTEGNIVGPKMTWTVEFDVDESPPPTDWDKISHRLNQKTSKSFNDYLVMSSRLISTTTTKLTTKSSFWESWTASQLAIATQNFVAYVEDEYGYVLTFTVEETMPVGFSPDDVMDAWAKHCWKGGGGISLGNFATLDNHEGGKDFSKVFSILPGTIVPPLVFEKKEKKQRWIIPSLLEEEIVSDDVSIQSKDGKISYKVTNPNLFTYPVHFHRGDVEFNYVGSVRGSSIEGYSTEECTKIVWTVTVRPYRKFLGGGVKFWTEANMRWSLRNLKLLLEDRKEAKQSRMSSGRKEKNKIDVVDPSPQNQQRDVGRNFPKIRRFDRGESSSSWSSSSSSSSVPGTRPTFTIPRPNTPDENNTSNAASSKKWGQG